MLTTVVIMCIINNMFHNIGQQRRPEGQETPLCPKSDPLVFSQDADDWVQMPSGPPHAYTFCHPQLMVQAIPGPASS